MKNKRPMKCSYCGVELEENVNYCSLCGKPVAVTELNNQTQLHTNPRNRDDKLMSNYHKLTISQKKKIFNKISAIILFSGAAISIVIDFILNNHLTWSRYPFIIALVLYVNIIITPLISKRKYTWMALSFLSISGLLAALDWLTSTNWWALKLAIPLLLVAYVGIFTICKIIANTTQKGLNVIAYAMLGAGILCLFTDGIISFYQKGLVLLNWSLIVMAAVVIIALLLLYIQYRLKKVTDLKRFFHI